jgi:tetratricopeptide (TPR) repeat protein
MFPKTIIPAYSNLALCHLKLGSYDSVISFCNQILNHDNSNVKAKYRRGLAYHKLKNVYILYYLV